MKVFVGSAVGLIVVVALFAIGQSSNASPVYSSDSHTAFMQPASSGATSPAQCTLICTISFSDVLPGSTFYSYVHWLACLGIVQGYPDGSFRPNDNVTRGQSPKVVAESVGYTDSIPPLQLSFNDVPSGSTFWLYIERVALHGVVMAMPIIRSARRTRQPEASLPKSPHWLFSRVVSSKVYSCA